VTYTTLEALRLAEEAFMKIADLRNLGKINPEVIAFETLYVIRAARAQEQAEQEPMMDYERINALREGEQNGAEDAYFFVRPENDTPSLRKMFCQGFERGFHKGLKYASHVRTKDLTDDEIARWFGAATEGSLIEFARAVIAADREKNK